MQIDHANHGHPLLLIPVDSSWEIGHLVDLDQRINISIKLVDVRLHQNLNPVLSQTSYEEYNDWEAHEDNYNVPIDIEELHQEGVNRDPEVREYNAPAEYAHHVVVVGDLFVVLEA